MVKRFLRWCLRGDTQRLPEIGERVWTGYASLKVVSMIASTTIRGEHEVTLHLVAEHYPGYDG